MSKDRWPKEWARPLYGPAVIAKMFVEAGKALTKKVQREKASK